MRLTCPKCGAQYEVDEAVIPDEGRDVQCSNCNHIWFQEPSGAAPRDPLAAFAAPRAPEPVAPGPEGADAPPAAGQAADVPPRRGLDEDVLSILREEAEREQRAREEEATAETFSEQADLGLASPPPPVRAKNPEPAPSPEPEPDPAPAEPSRSAARRDLLPDVEKITSTLSASTDRGAASIPPAAAARNGLSGAFLAGFLVAVLVAAAALAAYLKAPAIAALNPALEGQVAAYVETVDAARAWLAGLVPADPLDREPGR
ncbi:zinc-ribbon domain-containing protein [Rhodovulum sulfidophilum]|uniref:Zinc-ribbon domain-containing protein n=2 Tax=Rhodovulum sulfidophilum TaxID=35806 RepID=A0ABS1RNK1_RHOSU|nr:zinc-ribbon domain-containing protein [Rhodovulum sulfidophilum]MBL3607639.1 zinc-ribbon domain-containing protein [Rhodovulum sulfidophilum]